MKILCFALLLIILALGVGATRYFNYYFETDIIIICSDCDYHVSCESNSMGYTLGCNDTLIAVETRSKRDIKVGDIIFYLKHKQDNRTKLKYIIHRVVDKDYRGCYVTKGDNNVNEDFYKPCFYDIKLKIIGVLYGG